MAIFLYIIAPSCYCTKTIVPLSKHTVVFRMAKEYGVHANNVSIFTLRTLYEF